MLVGRGLLAEGETDDRVTTYDLTGAGRALLVQRAERLAVLCDRRGASDGMAGARRESRGD